MRLRFDSRRNFPVLTKKLEEILKSDEEITIQDFGVGSKKLTNKRFIKDIYKISCTKGKYADQLATLPLIHGSKRILELGTSLGVSSALLSFTNPSAQITSIEACTETFQVAKSVHSDLEISNVEIWNETFTDFIEGLVTGSKFDFIFD